MAKIAFVQNGYYESLGVACLSAVLKKASHRVELFISGDKKRICNDLLSFQPDIIAISCTTGFHKWYLELAVDLKTRKVPGLILFGGPHATFFPETIERPQVDALCVGEGEGAMEELAAAVDGGRDFDSIQNLWVRTGGVIKKNPVRPLIKDLDEVPFPDWDLYYGKYPLMKKRRMYFLSSRGCPYRCGYCFNHAMRKVYEGDEPYVRRRSVGNVLEEIGRAIEKYRFETVYFYDDTFNIDNRWVGEFCEGYRKQFSHKIACVLRANLIDENLVESLRVANCRYVYFAIESGNEKFRRDALIKNVTDGQIRRSAELLRKHGILFKTLNMAGMPSETMEQAFDTVRLNVEIGARFPHCSLYQPYPRTELGELARELGVFSGDFDEIGRTFMDRGGIAFPGYHRFVNLQRLFIYAVKFPWSFGLIKRLINVRSNFVFEILFFISYAWNYSVFEEFRLRDILRLGFRNFLAFFSRT